jgi:phenylacetate-CoA ligase
LEDLPYLTKEIIREQGERMLSHPLAGVRHHSCKTGGSTGLSCVIYYNQSGADYAAAATIYIDPTTPEKVT